jgi:hypothetical protein
VVVLRQGTSLNSMIQVAKDTGIQVSIHDKSKTRSEFLAEIGESLEKTPSFCLETTEVIAISNAPLRKTMGRRFEPQKAFVGELRCKVPSIWGYFALCTLAKKNGYGFLYDGLANRLPGEDCVCLVRSSTSLSPSVEWAMETLEKPHDFQEIGNSIMLPSQINITALGQSSSQERFAGIGACLELFSLLPESTHL